jgi:glycosyltransferase involved in cell wall biosynthesis
VVFADLIPDDQLPSYYRGAIALVFPTLYEGFGLPPLEAMASGTPVVTSSTTSLPEVVGDAAILVDPSSVEAIADSIERVVADSELRQALIVRGLEQAKRFTWGDTAARVQHILSKAIAEH